jgi:Flp pilus assembly protein TadG
MSSGALISRFLATFVIARSRRYDRERGAALVEYAFGILIFSALTFGINGFGHALYAYHFANNSAKEASRWAAVNGHTCSADNSCNGTAPMNNGPVSSTDVDNFVKNHASQGINTTKIATTACGLSDTPACPDSTPSVCTTAVPGIAGSPFPNYPSCTVRVTVGYAYQFIFPLLPTNTTITAPCTTAGFCLSSASELVIAH